MLKQSQSISSHRNLSMACHAQGKTVNLQSQLVLCRHILPKGVELWLLQPQSSRVQDSARRAMSNFLAAETQLLAGRAVLELNGGRRESGGPMRKYYKPSWGHFAGLARLILNDMVLEYLRIFSVVFCSCRFRYAKVLVWSAWALLLMPRL